MNWLKKLFGRKRQVEQQAEPAPAQGDFGDPVIGPGHPLHGFMMSAMQSDKPVVAHLSRDEDGNITEIVRDEDF